MTNLPRPEGRWPRKVFLRATPRPQPPRPARDPAGALVDTDGLSRVRGTASAMSTPRSPPRDDRAGPCAPPVAPGSWPPSAAEVRCLYRTLRPHLKTSNSFPEFRSKLYAPQDMATRHRASLGIAPLTAATYRAVTCRPGISGSRGGSIPSCRVWASSARSAPSCDAICNSTTREAMCPGSLGLGCIRSAAGNLRAVCRGLGGGEYGEVLAQSGDVQHLVHLR